MILPYLTMDFEVPTPAVKIQLIHPETNAKADGLARIDSGADITVVPFMMLEKLNLNAVGDIFVSGYDDPGKSHVLFACTLRCRFGAFKNLKVIAALTPHVLIGLDILNILHLCLNGKKKQLEIMEDRKKKRRK